MRYARDIEGEEVCCVCESWGEIREGRERGGEKREEERERNVKRVEVPIRYHASFPLHKRVVLIVVIAAASRLND